MSIADSVAQKVLTAEDYMKKAAAKSEEGDYIGAVENYDQAILLEADFARAYGNRGLVRANLGDRRGALEDWKQAAQLFWAQGKRTNYEMVMNYIEKFKN